MQALAAIGLHQGFVYARELIERSTKFTAADTLCRSSHKPFLVVGGPYGSSGIRLRFNIKAHGCGDLCTDVNPLACAGCPYQAGDICSLPFSANQFGAVFCSHVLEHMANVQDAAAAWSELNRVADSVFVCVPGKDSIGGWLAPGHHIWVHQMSNNIIRVEERSNSNIYLVNSNGVIESQNNSRRGSMRRHGIYQAAHLGE